VVQPNPYAPPQAAVADVSVPTAAGVGEPLFFAVSLTKLAVMSLCTGGLYTIFWFYWNWRLAKREGEDVWPVPRALFAVFFCHACFGRVRDRGAAMGVQPVVQTTALAWGWIIVTVLQRLPEPYWLVSLFAWVFVLPVQAYANRINAVAAPTHDRNSRFSVWNWIAVVVGGGTVVLAFVGTFLPGK
jgi:hypothetical protein